MCKIFRATFVSRVILSDPSNFNFALGSANRFLVAAEEIAHKIFHNHCNKNLYI